MPPSEPVRLAVGPAPTTGSCDDRGAIPSSSTLVTVTVTSRVSEQVPS